MVDRAGKVMEWNCRQSNTTNGRVIEEKNIIIMALFLSKQEQFVNNT
jgi:hypothetical protein